MDQLTAERTIVIFRADRDGDVTAVFPCEHAGHGYMTCYARVGQHSSCSIGWYRTTRAALAHEYADLKAELENYGYALDVRKRMPSAKPQRA